MMNFYFSKASIASLGHSNHQDVTERNDIRDNYNTMETLSENYKYDVRL